MPVGFIDSASIHGALAALVVGRHKTWPVWDRQSLLEATQLLMEDNIKIVPGPGPWHGAHGPVKHVLKAFPVLTSSPPGLQATANAMTKKWLRDPPQKLSEAMKNIRRNDDWAARQMTLFWGNHVRMHGALFNADYIPELSRLIDGCTERDLRRIHTLSEDPRTAQRWAKARGSSEASNVAELAWLLAAIIRGRYHEYYARERKLLLIPHACREPSSLKLRAESGPYRKTTNSEDCFGKMIIGSALLEKSGDGRVQTWVDNLGRGRNGRERFGLPEEPTLEDAENNAALAAVELGISSSSSLARAALECAINVGLSALVAITVSPWYIGTPVGPMVAGAYHHIFHKTTGESAAKVLLHNRRRFHKLARTVPGRIERYLK